jgi:AcrR family transcriptional regulator
VAAEIPRVRLRGRQAQAALNDATILQAAREVFVADPTAPISAVAKRAGVGIGALYHRYDGKEDLLRTLCRRGQDVYVEEIERALASESEPWEAFVDYLRRIVTANTHGLTARLAGTFTPSAEQLDLAERMRAMGVELFERVRGSGALRPDITYLDIEYLLEFLSTVKLGNAQRSAELRQRHLTVIIDGLHNDHHTPLQGEPPTWAEQLERWTSKSAHIDMP